MAPKRVRFISNNPEVRASMKRRSRPTSIRIDKRDSLASLPWEAMLIDNVRTPDLEDKTRDRYSTFFHTSRTAWVPPQSPRGFVEEADTEDSEPASSPRHSTASIEDSHSVEDLHAERHREIHPGSLRNSYLQPYGPSVHPWTTMEPDWDEVTDTTSQQDTRKWTFRNWLLLPLTAMTKSRKAANTRKTQQRRAGAKPIFAKSRAR